MKKITVSYTRPSTTVDWGPNVKSPELLAHYQATYLDTKMMASATDTISPDGLTLTRSNCWNDSTDSLTGVEIMLAYKTDEIIQNWIIERNNYNAANGIIPSVPFDEIITHEDNLMFNDVAAGPFEHI